MFDLVRLRVLRAVADQGTLAAAAEVLSLTPSAVSQQMAKLEREARCALVERHGRRIRLTEEGHVLARHAHRILGAVEEAAADLDRRRGEVLGDLTVAAFPTAARGLLPAVVVGLAVTHPRARVRLLEMEPYEAVAAVARGDVDLAVSQDWGESPAPLPDRLRALDLGHDLVDVALPAGHPLAARSPLSVADLAAERWISAAAGTSCHDWLISLFRAADRLPDVAHQATEFPTQLTLVAAGLGVALVPRLAGDQVPAGVVLRPVQPRLSRRVFSVWRAESAGRPGVRALLDAVRREWHSRCDPATRSL
ncbi:LysR family transcriptional regulator [Actinokineospora enzanensis]|uniref:LysR family transcriptional regulator n=1 Tax=Actinokineospora enzanensis TaxID=155975 RepID=UPI000369D2C5|nr:LysR family transcriptional regulator [Actinokineospora enzanensis]